MKLGAGYWCLLAVVMFASCKPLPFKVKDGKTAIELKLYNQSIDFQVKEFHEEKDPGKQEEKAFSIAEAYRKFNDLPNAEKWYRQSLDLKGGEKSLLNLGLVLKGHRQCRTRYFPFYLHRCDSQHSCLANRH